MPQGLRVTTCSPARCHQGRAGLRQSVETQARDGLGIRSLLFVCFLVTRPGLLGLFLFCDETQGSSTPVCGLCLAVVCVGNTAQAAQGRPVQLAASECFFAGLLPFL